MPFTKNVFLVWKKLRILLFVLYVCCFSLLLFFMNQKTPKTVAILCFLSFVFLFFVDLILDEEKLKNYWKEIKAKYFWRKNWELKWDVFCFVTLS